MKLFKSIMIMAALLYSTLSFSQGKTPGVNRGPYGTQSDFQRSRMYTVSGSTGTAVLKNYGVDTLTNGDTGYVYVWVGQGYASALELVTTVLTGTVATTQNILFAVNNGGAKMTPAQVLTATAVPGINTYTVTGNTTYCAGCVGASSTVVPGASKKYTWQIPNNQGCLFDNFIIRTVQTGTATATYTGNLTTQY